MRRRSKKYVAEKNRVSLTTGEAIQILREFKGWTQEELARRSGIAATNISRLENGYLELGKQRAIALAKAFGVHPATLMFPDLAIPQAA